MVLETLALLESLIVLEKEVAAAAVLEEVVVEGSVAAAVRVVALEVVLVEVEG